MASSSEKPPLLFMAQLGALRPHSQAAVDAMKAITGLVRVKVTAVNRNQRRRAFYWVLLSVAAQALHDRHGIDMDAELLHDTLKRKLGLGDEVVLPSGEIVFRPKSTSDRAMNEVERAAWTDRVVNTLSRWLEVPPHMLLDEARARDGGEP
jgi:hypothetical protein